MVKTLRNTKGQFAGSIGEGKTKTPTASTIKPQYSHVASNGYGNPEQTKVSADYLNRLDQIRSAKSRLTANEKNTLNLGYSLALGYPQLVTNGIDGAPLTPSNLSFKDVQSKLSGLHFAKEMLSPLEREVLSISEDLLRKIDPKSYTSTK